MTPPPERVPCPCDGRLSGSSHSKHAERVDVPTVQPYREGVGQATHWQYRHENCPYGGTVVVVDGEIVRRAGPLFEPGRYHMPEAPATSTGPKLQPGVPADD